MSTTTAAGTTPAGVPADPEAYYRVLTERNRG